VVNNVIVEGARQKQPRRQAEAPGAVVVGAEENMLTKIAPFWDHGLAAFRPAVLAAVDGKGDHKQAYKAHGMHGKEEHGAPRQALRSAEQDHLRRAVGQAQTATSQPSRELQ
jgi:hypothetical protein